jgi:esterase FrsA
MSEPRSLEEVKNDIRSRVGHRAPFLHADKTEAEEALAHMPTLEGETWAAAWNELGARWEARANDAEKAGNAAQAKEAFLKSYGYYGIARHPFPSTPGKNHGYRKTREMFLAAAKYFDIPVERVSIPFQGKAIVGHLRFPKELPAPMIMHWGGIDNWKEERHSFGESFVKENWGCFIMDSPGTGECPMLAGPDAHAIHLAALDYLLERPEVDSSKIAVVGASLAAIGRQSSPTPCRTNCAAQSTGAVGSTIFFSRSGKRARATPTPIFLISSKPAPISSARKLSTSFAP